MTLVRWSARRILACWVLGLAVEAVVLWGTLRPDGPAGPGPVTVTVWVETPPGAATPPAALPAAARWSLVQATVRAFGPWLALYALIPLSLGGLTVAWLLARRNFARAAA